MNTDSSALLHRPLRSNAWSRLSTSDLLSLRVKELNLSLTSAGLDHYVRRLHAELARRGFRYFRPSVYFGDEWFCPGGAATIAVPFYLAHPRLTRLQRRSKQRVEGDQPNSFMKLLRHEAGHAFDHAYGISDQAEWRRIFGDKDRPYNTERYRKDPTSRDFVIHLEDHYAQSHPEEDFAETFAIVITPGSQWRQTYRHWPLALRKLRYVEALITRYKNRQPLPEALNAPQTYHAARLQRTLARHYRHPVAH